MVDSRISIVAVAILAVSTWASPLPEPQGGISVFRTGNGIAAGSTYSSGPGYSGGTSVFGGGGDGYTVTSFGSGGPGQVYYFGNGGRPLRSGSGTYYNTRSNPGGVTFHRFGSGSGGVFPRTSFFPGVGVGTGAYAGGGTGAFAGAGGGAFASAGGLGVWAGK